MPTNYSINLYTIRARMQREVDNYLTLSDLVEESEEYEDLFDGMVDLFNKLSAAPIKLTDIKRSTKVTMLDQNDRLLYGMIESGQYGRVGDIEDTNTGDISYTKTRADADMMPFYFFVDIPDGHNEGVIGIQSTGLFGIKSALSKIIRNHFKSLYPNIMIDINPLIPMKYFNMLIRNGSFRKVHFIRHSLPSDIAQAFSVPQRQEVKTQVKLTIDVKDMDTNAFKATIRDWLNNRDGSSDLMELVSMPYEEMALEIGLGSNNKKVYLSNPNKLRPSYRVTYLLEFDGGGNPTFDSLHEAAQEIRNNFGTSV